MKPISNLDELLEKAKAGAVFGTKMRSVVKSANESGIAAITAQQFEVGHRILDAGLVPIIEPEIDINCPEKSKAEDLLKPELLKHLDQLSEDQVVMLKLTLPEQANLYSECINHSNCIKVVALSGGYSREEANRRLSQNKAMVASFSRALTEGLSAQQNDEEFNKSLDQAIQSIFEASST